MAESKFLAFYCVFAAWTKSFGLQVYDEFVYAVNEADCRVQFETAIQRKFGVDWRESHSNREIVIRDLTRVVKALAKE